MRFSGAIALSVLCILGSSMPEVRAAEPASQLNRDDVLAARDRAVSRGIEFLRSQQADDGSFTPAAGPAITAIVAASALRSGLTMEDPLVARGLAYVEKFVQSDGGICAPDSPYRNYETCISIMCLTEANKDGRYDRILAGAEAFLKGIQWDEGEGHDESSTSYGGAGYGSHKRPDLSNTSFLIDALRELGNGPEDEAMQKALVFVSRCQNLETAHNTTEFAAKNPDGGFYYTVAAGGTSQAGQTETGGLRSYGSMTYAGLKSMIYAGLGPDDERVQAATQWLQQNYTLETNPGMGDAGLYYYFHTFAKALDALGQEVFVETDGTEHPWRLELVHELVQRQRPDGSWLNDTSRWLEGDPNLVTAYALLALSYGQPEKR